MTAIVCTRSQMVSDRKLIIGGDLIVPCTKICKMKAGDIIGTAGESEDGEAFIEWYQRKNREEHKPTLEVGKDADAFEALVLTKEKDILWFNASLRHVRIEMDYFAIGSAAKSLLCLMKVGKTPKEAIEIVSFFDSRVSPEIDILEL